MKLSVILQEKGGSVVTVNASDSLQRSAEILDQNRIGATVAVDSKGNVVGVLSELHGMGAKTDAGGVQQTGQSRNGSITNENG